MNEPLVTELLEAALERRWLVFEVLSLLTPFDLPQERKVRIGRPGSGGWVLVDRLRPTQPVLSFVASDRADGFAEAMAERGHDVRAFDLPALAGALSDLPPGADAPILKAELDGAEWQAFGAVPAELLARCEQVALSLHFSQQLGNPEFNGGVQSVLRKLTRHFTLCHVRAGPRAELRVLGGFPVLSSLDLTFIRSDLVVRAPSITIYPTPLDAPAAPQQWPEHLLWFFPFAPVASAPALPDEQEPRPPAIALSSTDSVELNNAGFRLLELGRRLEALRHFDRALELAPDEPTIVYNRGNALVALGRHEEALSAYDRALASRPGDIGALNNRACVLGLLKRFDEALASLDAAAALNPDDPSTLANRRMIREAIAGATSISLYSHGPVAVAAS